MKYSVLPGKAGALAAEELEEYAAKKLIDDVVARLLESQNVSEVQQRGGGDVQITYSKESEDVPATARTPVPARHSTVPQQFIPRA